LHYERFVDTAGLGAAIGALVLVGALRLRRSQRSLLFALLLAATAGMYLGGALGLRHAPTLAAETTAFVLFGAAAFWGARVPLVLGLVWPLHALWDLVHFFEFVHTSIPRVYEVGCVTADLVWGFMILGRPDLFAPRGSGAPSAPAPRGDDRPPLDAA
jgi:hypothetical protein